MIHTSSSLSMFFSLGFRSIVYRIWLNVDYHSRKSVELKIVFTTQRWPIRFMVEKIAPTAYRLILKWNSDAKQSSQRLDMKLCGNCSQCLSMFLTVLGHCNTYVCVNGLGKLFIVVDEDMIPTVNKCPQKGMPWIQPI